MRVALVHDWLTGMRGGERVLEEIIRQFPGAELFTLVHARGSVSATIERMRIRGSWLNRLPGVRHWYRYALPLFPRAVEKFDLRGFQLVISSSHCAAKGVRVPPGIPHVCYCHTPMRYLYDQHEAYARRASTLVRAALSLTRGRLQHWDLVTSARVSHFLANSRYVQQRIARIYGQPSTVVYPPVDVDRFQSSERRDDYYVTVSALVPYKRVDLVVQAFNTLGRKLVVIGSGPERKRLQRLAGSNITFTGWVSDVRVAALLARARGFVFAGEEDFGIALVEAQAAGAPVIAYAGGGAQETVIDGETGILFQEQTVPALLAAFHRAEQHKFAPATLRSHAAQFRPERFRESLQQELNRVLQSFKKMRLSSERSPTSGWPAPELRTS